jgi:hypothetical protein
MFDQVEINKAHKIAEKGFQNVELVCKFIDERYRNSISGVQARSIFQVRDDSLIGLWHRSYSWIKSLSRLNQETDFQPITTANRALLEILIDMILLHNDKTNGLAETLFWWSQSEKLKVAECKIKFQQNNNIEIDSECQGFITREGDEIRSNRKRIWNCENKHPNYRRWTQHDLAFDVKEADKIYLSEIKKVLGTSLEEFYETKYRMMNWNIHSGVSAFWQYSPAKFSYDNFFYMWDSASFGVLCTRILMSDLGLDKTIPSYEKFYEDLLTARHDILKNQ